MRKQTQLVLCIAVILGMSAAIADKKPVPRPNTIHEEGVAERGVQYRVPPVLQSASITWTVIDSMGNCYGMLSNRVKPFSYDPASGDLAYIHRGHAAYGPGGTGQLWYNVSTNGGTTWTRVSELNAGAPFLSRYPSGTISNPTGGSQMLFVHASPQLLPGGAAFGHTIYGVDIFGAATPFALVAEGDGTFWSNTAIWTATDNDWVLWTTRRGAPNTDFYLWRTNDFVSITEGVPTTWTTANYASLGLDIGGTYRNGRHVFALWADFAGDPITPDANIGYSASTDNGATWSSWVRPQPDWRVTGVGPYQWWNFGGAGVFSFDMAVDANNRVHFFGVVVDTLTQQRGIVEIYETGTGWSYKHITMDLKESTVLTYNGLNQMGNHLNSAVSPDGQVMALFWLDAAQQGDTEPDIWFAYRRIADASWSAPVNLTQTPGPPAEILLQVAPDLRHNGGNSYTAFIGRAYDCTGAVPPNDLGCTNIFVGTHTFTADPTSVGDNDGLPSTYRMEQNFPNPFNPETRIEFSLPQGGHVRVAVYDVLGREVALLVNETREAGTHEVLFNANALPSGVYFYTMSAGSFAETKKMVLMK